MRASLRACIACSRHVRVTAAQCPFCLTVLPESHHAPVARGTPAVRLGRAAAAFMLGTTGAVGGVTACSSTSDTPPVADGGPEAGADAPITGFDAYGTVALPEAGLPYDAGPDASGEDAGPDAPITAADAYGTVPFPDANQPETDAAESDAADDH